MNETCGKCGGFTRDFVWAGDSTYARVCECENGIVSELEDAQNELDTTKSQLAEIAQRSMYPIFNAIEQGGLDRGGIISAPLYAHAGAPKDTTKRFIYQIAVKNPESRWWNLKPAYLPKKMYLAVDEDGFVCAVDVNPYEEAKALFTKADREYHKKTDDALFKGWSGKTTRE